MKKLRFRVSSIGLSLAVIASALVSIPIQVAVAPEAESATTSICSGNGVKGESSANGFTVVKYELTAAANTAGTSCEEYFRVPAGVTQIEFLSVSGGGGGGHDGGGGGGGGGVLYYKNYNVTPGADLYLKVGAGGAPAGSSCSNGNCPEGGTGITSIFNWEQTQGGAGGGGRDSDGVASQGSGGGAGHDNDSNVSRAGGDSTGDSDIFYVTYGNDGGANSNTYGGGGGGSATNTGSNTGGVGAAGGNGGNGFYSEIEGAGAYYGGGGGGGTYTGGTRTSGGQGGGGAGGNNSNAGANGTNGLGGGGGGGGDASRTPGRGGGGVIIVRYQSTCSISSPTTYNTGIGSDSKNLVRITSSNVSSSCTGSWTVPANVTSVEVFVLGGGGGGGGKLGAGGGSGGAINNTAYSVSGISSVSITVGGGGRGGYGSWDQSASNGANSIFGNLTAYGGGAGGDENSSGVIGGSGGGAGGGGLSTANAAAPRSPQADGTGTKYGSGGGAKSTSANAYGSGGGGGLGGNGGNGSSTSGGAGGAGISIYGYSLGGGGGGGVNTSTGAGTATRGGGAGGNNVSGNQWGGNATASTGGGGGGGANFASGFGGDGGSGVIIILYATNLTLTFNSNYGTPTTSTQTIPANTSTNLSTNSFTRAGYSFANWNTQANGSGTTYANLAAISISTATTIYAQWSVNTLTITYNTRGGSTISNGSTTTGGSISASPGTPTKAGYDFLGWATASYGTPITFPYTHNQTADFSLFAQWGAKSLTIVYDTQGGSSIPNGAVLTGSYINPAPATPTWEGHTFNGWFVAPTGGTAISNFSTYTHNQTSNFTLYAQWTTLAPNLSSVTVTGTALSGSVITATPSASGAGPITFSYQWYRILSGLGTFLIDGATSSAYTLTDSDLLGYAFVNVTASNAGGSSSTVIGSMPNTPKVGVVTPTISGYLQSGQLLTGVTTSTIPAGARVAYKWLRSDSAAGSYTAISSATNSTYRLTSSDVGKYIKFTITISETYLGTSLESSSAATNVVIDLHTILYAAGGGGGSGPTSPTTVSNGSTFILPTNTFTKTGYSFAGWSDGTSTYQAGDTYPAAGGNVSHTATWTANSLTITYESQSGSAISAGSTVTDGSISASPGTPTRTSYRFNGWFASPTGGSAISFPYTHSQTADFTLYAQWSAFAEIPSISSQPSSATKYAGQSVTFSISASAADSGALSYQWKKNGTDISGAITSSYAINSVASGDAGSYTVVITNTLNGATATATSNAAVLTFGTPTLLGTPNSPGTTAVSGSTTAIGITYSTVANATSHTVKVYAAGVLVGTARTSFVSGTTITGLTAGTTYTVTVTAIGDGSLYSDSAESAASTITTNAVAVIPTINSQPASATKYAGQSVDFTVNASASDSGSLSYQWKKNGTAISGAQSSTLSINPISSSDAGDYTVDITNTKNGTTASITSNTATLTFATATQLSTPTAPTVSATSGSTTSITVSFASVANASSYTVKVYASNVLVGTAHTSFTSGSAISDLSSNTAYTVTVTAIGDGTIYSDSAASSATSVTTNAVAVTPTISSHPSSSSKYTGQSVTFSVTASASDSGSLSYQWKVGGVSISGANSATYTIGTLATGNSGDYIVTVTNSKNGSFASVTSNVATLTVTVQTFTVTYTAPDKSGGSVPVDSAGPYVSDATVTLLANTGGLTRGNYAFAGWRTASDPTARAAGSTYVITADITFIAVWNEIFQLSFDANGGSGTMADVDGPTITIPNSTFTRTGYTFSGWNTAANGSGFTITVGTSGPLPADITIYAQWTQDQVTTNTITFATISNKTYGDSFSVTVSASSGLTVTVSSSTTSVCTVSTLTVTAISVGTCTLVAAQGGNGTHPAATSVTNTFIVGKKSLVITASDQSGTVGNSTSAPSYSQSGLVTALGDAIGSVSYTYVGSGSTRYAQSSNAPASGGNWILGTYKITPASLVLSSGSASNYNISYAQGTLTVSGTSTTGISGISVKSTGLNKTTELLSGFSAATTSYGIYVESAVSSVTVVITRTSGSLANAQVSVNDSGFRRLTFTSNAANSGILALPQQSNTITLKIVATDLSVQTYTISILRDQATSSATGGIATPTPTASPRAANQVINSVAFYVNSTSGNTSSLIEVSMNRSFDKAVSSYTVSFTNAQSVTQLRTLFSDPGLTIRIKMNQGAFRTIPSSGASTSLALNEGANTAILRVASSDGTVADYTFTLNRAA